MGLGRIELPTSRLSGVRSNHLSYRPPASPIANHYSFFRFLRLTIGVQRKWPMLLTTANDRELDLSRLNRCIETQRDRSRMFRFQQPEMLLRKEVIQPQVPLRLPCYDFTPITSHTLGACFPCGLAQQLLVQRAFVV